MRILLVISVLFMVASCSRYEDGPLISLKSPEARLSSSWQYDLVLRNGVNVTKGEGSTDINYALSALGFDETGRFTMINETDSGEVEMDGFWTLGEKKTSLSLDFIEDTFGDRSFEILRLKKDELWMREELGSVVFEYHCSPN